MNVENSVNLVLQGKGGVGKSFLSTILSQYFKDHKKVKFFGADTDPVNSSFASVKRLKAKEIEILKDGAIIQSKFDGIFESIIGENATFVVDNGASTFVPMVKYIKDNDVISLFDDIERPVFIHTVIVGGQSNTDTLQGLVSLNELISNSTKVKLIIWFNEFQGDVNFPDKIKELVAEKTAGIVTIKNRNSDAFTDDLEKMTKERLTLVEVNDNPNFGLMAKNRLKRVYSDIYEQLDQIYDNAQNA